MIRAELVSSMMASAGYDPTSRVLEIEFAAGTVYRYFDVPLDVYQALLDAPSQGRYFHGCIRGAFPFQRADEVSAQ
jgi:KTSC domain